jgi:hypothetical protein
MSESDDIAKLDDPTFIDLRRRVREQLESMPEHEVSAELAARFQRLDEEFLRRARIAWTQDS